MGAAATILVLILPAAAQQPTKAPAYPPPGKLVDVGGRRLHIHCAGKGEPTVVLEAGGGDFSLDWGLVQPRLADFTRVCTYDRAGYGWSDAGPMPRTMQQIVAELQAGLKKTGIKGPYIFAGQSFGGLLARVYTSQYPEEVAGVVLIDSSHEDMQIMMNNKLTRLRELSRGREIPPVQVTMAPPAPASDGTAEAAATQSKVEPPYDKLAPQSQQIRLWAVSQPKYGDARSSEFDFLAEELARMHAERAQQEHPLGDRPLIVLTRGKNVSEGHQRLQADLVRLSRNSKQMVAQESGHHIHLDDPEAVAEAVRQVVNAVRRHAKLN